jgi:hypothetical protein
MITLEPGQLVTVSLDVLIDDPDSGTSTRLGLADSLTSVPGDKNNGSSIIGLYRTSGSKTMTARNITGGNQSNHNGDTGVALTSNHWYRMVVEIGKSATSNDFETIFGMYHLGADGTNTPVQVGSASAVVDNIELYTGGGYAGFRLATSGGASSVGAIDNFKISLGPDIQIVKFETQENALLWSSRINRSYAVGATHDLNTPWTNLTTGIASEGAVTHFNDTSPPASQKFYRIEEEAAP